jgi:hypothetical protein
MISHGGITMLRRSALLAILLFVPAFFFAGSVRGGTVTYKIMNYPEQQDGWMLSGYITIKTNAANGTLTENDVQSWSVTVKKGDVSVTYGSNDPGVGVEILGTVNYTPTQILLPRGTRADPNAFELSGDARGSNSVGWNNYPAVSGRTGGVYNSFYVDPMDKRRHTAWSKLTTTLGGKATWVIATAVAEPPAILSAGVGFACVVLCAVVRQRRQGRGMIPSDRSGIACGS